MINVLHKCNDMIVKASAIALHFYNTYMSEIVGGAMLLANLLLAELFSDSVFRLLQNLFGTAASLLLAIGGGWYLSKQVFDSRKAKMDLKKSIVEDKIKEKELCMKELDLIAKEKDLDLYEMSRTKMELEEEIDRLRKLKELEGLR